MYEYVLCGRHAPLQGSLWERAHLAHLAHGARKTDELGAIPALRLEGHPCGVIIKCAQCHFAEHGLKWPKRARVKPMTEDQFAVYFASEQCLCAGPKASTALICEACRDILRDNQPALLHVIETGSPETVRQALAEWIDLINRQKAA